MALDDDIRILSAVRLFEGFTREQLRLMAFGAESLRIGAGKELYLEGDTAESAYIVTSGRIRLFRERDGDVVLLGTVGPGTMLGELGLIAETKRLTGAIAEIDTEAVRLSRKMFRRILEEFPEVAAMLQQRITEELQDLITQIAKLAPRFA
ncbi:MAG TPA: cyclic nucleotide-binding domain-containing protein [Rhizobiaceae bacterium]|nr:cyclic nucleotide-binding domain-containing protein [Rhizobiaceae bacterium]